MVRQAHQQVQKLSIGLFLIALLVAAGCKKLPTYPDVPVLEYNSVTFTQGDFGPTFTLTATVTDGDGDLGYHDSGNGEFDSLSSPYYKNFVVTVEILRNNDWVDVRTVDTLYTDVGSRLPYLTPTGAYKALKAEIHKTDYMPLDNLNPTETFRFTAFVYDRALHKSNTITTPEFTVNLY